MARSVCHVASDDDAGTRIDSLLARLGLYGSRSAAAKAVSEGRVLIGGAPARKSSTVQAGDVIVCELDEPAGDFELVPEAIPLDVRYEDDDLLVVCKPAGMLTHPSPEHAHGTLANALLAHCGPDHLCDVQGERDRPGIVHRLDGDTSGLMLAAKSDEAGLALMEAIRAREVDRRYVALVHGIIPHETAMVDAPIARHPSERNRMAVIDSPKAREAITTLRVLERFSGTATDNGYTLVECKLFTGRTHQIRVHMQYTGHPVVGDATYTSGAPRDPRSQLGLTRQFLHSCRIGFDHPIRHERIELSDALPDDLANALATIRERSVSVTAAGEELADIIHL